MTEENKVAATAQRLIRVVEEFRKLDPEIQAQQILVFAHVMAEPGITMRELEKRAGLGSSTISRNVAALSKIHRKKKPGHDLIEAYEQPDDRRYKQVKLTPKGKRVSDSLQHLLS